MLPLRARVDLSAMAMKEYFAFPKALGLLKPHHQIVLCHIQDICLVEYYPFVEMQSVYSTALADYAIFLKNFTFIDLKTIVVVSSVFNDTF